MNDYKENIIEYYYYIMLENKGTFGIAYKDKQQAIRVFMDNLKSEIELGKNGSEHWKKHSQKYLDMIKNNQVKVIEIKKEITRTFKEEVFHYEF